MPISTIQNASLASGVPNSAAIGSGTITQTNLASNVAGTGPSFSAFKPFSAGNQSISAGVPTVVTFQATLWNQGNCYSTSTSRFTPNVAGYYQINVTLGPNLSITAPNSTNIYISKNGDIADQDNYVGYRYYPPTSNANYIFGTSAMMYLNGTTDYVVVYTDNGNILAGDVSGGSDRTFFQAFLARAA